MTTWEFASAKLGAKLKLETRSIAKEVFDAAQKAGHDVWYLWGMGSSDEHKTGLAIDFMVKNEAAGDFVRNYIWAHRARLRLRHVIWEQHITSTVTQPGLRRKMSDRGNSTKNHYDHVHMFVFPGKYQPMTYPKPSTAPNQVAVTGELDHGTIALWQKLMGTPIDGVITKPGSTLVQRVQWRLRTVDPTVPVNGRGIEVGNPRFSPTVAALQRYLKSPVDGKIDKKDSEVVKALQRRLNTGKF